MRIPEKIDVYENKFKSFEIQREEDKIFLVIEGRRKAFEITLENLIDILDSNTVSKSLVRQDLIAVELDNGELYFTSKNTELYKEAYAISGIKLKDLDVGDKIELMDGNIGTFGGSFYYVYTSFGNFISKIRHNIMFSDNAFEATFLAKDIYRVVGFEEKFSNKAKNIEHLDEAQYFSTMEDIRAHATKNNLDTEYL